ncbi:MAG TPA: 2-succinyl-5-enolpyruvyl-6-hydroxy-3-cyclohexene-1-carboxylic-acid synthase [Cryomorphaceae bacterium]|nr:2-succinyl-5-enolpyruvyl-6-hydroxy-3-cyclohexene-1-carboxylic-acid synthase [Cryomorphaceae bacterium]
MGKKKIEISDKQGIYTLIAACRAFGVHDVVICPGSRNAPLTISFNRSGFFKCHSLADERAAGFYALGMSLASNRPVALVCTSGSAVANFAPAMAEAFYLNVPIIACTADRPLAWTDQGNGQTIRQTNIFENFSVNEFSLISEPQSRDEMWLNRRMLSKCFNDAIHRKKGPVHINVPLAEPLYGTQSYPDVQKPVFYKSVKAPATLSAEREDYYAHKVSSAKKVMILPGQGNPDEKLNAILEKWAELSNTVILTETTSNVNVGKAVDTIDRLVMPVRDDGVFEDIMPDILISFNGYVVSKKIKSLLREFHVTEHWHINEYDSGLDTYQNLTDEILVDPVHFLKCVYEKIEKPSGSYRDTWQNLKTASQKAHEEYISGIAYSDFMAFRAILGKIPNGANLHMANSTPVRYVQLFGHQTSINYFGNRGTSGIDGCTSTAAGYALKTPDEKNVLVTGDTAFLYDSNAFWNRNFPSNLKVVVINNSGGGIFRIIPGPNKIEELEEFFETHHPANLEGIAATYGLPFARIDKAESLDTGLQEFFQKEGAGILEIQTPRKENAPVLKHYFKHLTAQTEKLWLTFTES